MEKWNISDRELANKLNKRELSVLVSTNSTITSLEKPDWNQENGVKPGVHVKNCNYLNYLKKIQAIILNFRHLKFGTNSFLKIKQNLIIQEMSRK